MNNCYNLITERTHLNIIESHIADFQCSGIISSTLVNVKMRPEERSQATTHTSQNALMSIVKSYVRHQSNMRIQESYKEDMPQHPEGASARHPHNVV